MVLQPVRAERGSGGGWEGGKRVGWVLGGWRWVGGGGEGVWRIEEGEGKPAQGLIGLFFYTLCSCKGSTNELGAQPPCRTYRSLRLLDEIKVDIDTKLKTVVHKEIICDCSASLFYFV